MLETSVWLCPYICPSSRNWCYFIILVLTCIPTEFLLLIGYDLARLIIGSQSHCCYASNNIVHLWWWSIPSGLQGFPSFREGGKEEGTSIVLFICNVFSYCACVHSAASYLSFNLCCIQSVRGSHVWVCLSFLQVIDHIDKISTIRKCSFILAASDIFSAKVSGTFKRFC